MALGVPVPELLPGEQGVEVAVLRPRRRRQKLRRRFERSDHGGSELLRSGPWRRRGVLSSHSSSEPDLLVPGRETGFGYGLRFLQTC